MTRDRGGYVVPPAFAEDLHRATFRDSPFRSMVVRYEMPPMTWRRRVAWALSDFRYALARRLYPAAFREDDDE